LSLINQKWKVNGYSGQHDEDGCHIVSEDGTFLFSGCDIYTVARSLGVSHHSPEAWKLYYDLANHIVEIHNGVISLK